MMRIEIDPHSGFCGGVIRAIGTAETYLRENGAPLFSLGAIVHNEEELSRLRGLGLQTVDDIADMVSRPQGCRLLIRAHGEPPEVYDEAERLGLGLIDCTCPVVLKLQKMIRDTYAAVRPGGGQLLLFGKAGHPEVLGLVGQVGGDVVTFQDPEELPGLISSAAICTDRDIELFSQTTMSPSAYRRASEILSSRMEAGARLNVHETICSQVASRHRELSEFARSHDVILFVSGNESSNGKVLFELCRSVNPRTFHIGSASDLDAGWLDGAASAGVCGATSTPKWLLEEVARAAENLQ